MSTPATNTIQPVPSATRARRAPQAGANTGLKASYRQRAKGDRQFVEALARGLAILRCFHSGDRYLGNQEIAERTGLPKPTISRLTHTLTHMGFLSQSARRDEYALGVGVLALGHAYLAALSIREVARPLMQEFADSEKVTVALGEADGPRMVILDIYHGSPTYRLRLDIGERVPHKSTALGHAYLAGLPEERRAVCIQRLCDRTPAESRAEFLADVKRSLRDYEKHGFVVSCGDWRPDIFTAGVPLVSADGRVFSLSCIGPSFEMTRKRLVAEIAPRLVELRNRIYEAANGLF